MQVPTDGRHFDGSPDGNCLGTFPDTQYPHMSEAERPCSGHKDTDNGGDPTKPDSRSRWVDFSFDSQTKGGIPSGSRRHAKILAVRRRIGGEIQPMGLRTAPLPATLRSSQLRCYRFSRESRKQLQFAEMRTSKLDAHHESGIAKC